MEKSYTNLIIFISLALFAVGGFLLWNAWSFRSSSQLAQGKIVGFESRMNNSRVASKVKPEYAPKVQFSTPEGKEVHFTSKKYFEEGVHQLDQIVPIRFLPASPDQAQLDLEKGAYTQGMWAIGIAILALLLALFGPKK